MDREKDGHPSYLDYEPSYVSSYSFRDQYAPMSIGHWIFVLVMTVLPGINLLFLLFWAFSASINKNLRNYSRAVLIVVVVGLVLSGVAYGVLHLMHIPFPKLGMR